MSTSDEDAHDQSAAKSVPPWEEKIIAQVPYMDSSSAALSSAEREALPSLWAARATQDPMARSYSDSNTHRTYARVRRNYVTVDDDDNDCPNHHSHPTRTPMTAPILGTPREKPIPLPPAPKSATSVPSFVNQPSPSSNFAFSRANSVSTEPASPCDTSPAAQTHQSAGTVPTFPGTMSSRDARARTRSHTQSSRKQSQKKPGLASRWKMIVKDMFTRDDIDESQFVTIEDRHWTDDY